jgi:outer membrane receptor protein involved in Fe transport
MRGTTSIPFKKHYFTGASKGSPDEEFRKTSGAAANRRQLCWSAMTQKIPLRSVGVWTLASLFAALLASTPVAASTRQQTSSGTIHGVVKDSSGAPVPDVTVVISRLSDNQPNTTARTDTEGRFVVGPVPAGTYRVSAAREGFTAASADVTVSAGSQQEIELIFTPARWTESVETVSRIQEQTLKVPLFVSGVSKEELENVAPSTLEDAMRSIPGLQHATQANVFTRFETRGLRDTQDVLVLIDGVPLRQMTGNADLTMLPASAVQGIEFVKGPASSIYGRNAVGGVAQFFTIPNDANRITADLTATAASWGTGEAGASIQAPLTKVRLSAAGSLSRSDTYQRDTGRDTEFITSAVQMPLRRALLKTQYLYSHVLAGRGSSIPVQNGRPLFGITARDNFGIADAHFDATWNAVTQRVDVSLLGGRAFLTNSLNVNRYARWYSGGILIVPPPEARSKGYFESDSVQDVLTDDLVLRWDATFGHVRSTSLVGATVELGRQWLDQPTFTNAPTYRGPDYLTPVPGPLAANPPEGIRGATVRTDYGQHIESPYFQQRLETGRLGVVAGLRWDRFHQDFTRSNADVESVQTASRLSPRVGVDYQALQRSGSDLALFGNWVEGFRPQFPSLSTLNAITVPQILRPERTRSVEGGVKGRTGGVFVQASVFNMRKVDGQRSFRTGPDDFLFVNATSRVRGLESEVRARLGKAHSIYAHYSFHDAKHIEFRPSPTLDFSGNRVRMSPRHLAGAGYTLNVGRWAWASSIGTVGERPLRDNVTDQATNMLPAYTTINSSISYEVGRARVILAGSNLTDELYIADDMSATDSGYPGPPRRVAFQVRYRF